MADRLSGHHGRRLDHLCAVPYLRRQCAQAIYGLVNGLTPDVSLFSFCPLDHDLRFVWLVALLGTCCSTEHVLHHRRLGKGYFSRVEIEERNRSIVGVLHSGRYCHY